MRWIRFRYFFFFSSRRRHTRCLSDWSSDVCSSDLGTSKGAGDLSHRIVAKLGDILVHGVALKPGKPLCLAVVAGKPLVVLPGFPTSAIFTFHAFVAPVIRARAGLPPQAARSEEHTSELQSLRHLVCRLLLEKKKNQQRPNTS